MLAIATGMYFTASTNNHDWMPKRIVSNINQPTRPFSFMSVNENKLFVTTRDSRKVVPKRKKRNRNALTPNEYTIGTIVTFKA
tara:strand:+ start:299 stop:547 length:249 start_codon:yes stop_codon:yes gene_type:complete